MKSIIPVIAVLFCMATAAEADPCKLVRETVVDMHADDNGHVAVPVSINGEKLDFIVDTGSYVTALSSETADKLGLPRRPQNHSAETVFGGFPVTQYVMADRFMIGTLTAYRDNFAVVPNGALSGIDGLLGSDILAANDIDLDFAGNKFSIFSQSHCYGGVVYWTQAGFAQIPIRHSAWHDIELDASVDGQAMDAALDTGAPLSVMSLEYAERAFNIDPKSPDLKALPEN
ncbi:MAG TPA: aspartyl protease family protein, partial [Rhizomicrobium sp.]